jgi:hypothetical protein
MKRRIKSQLTREDKLALRRMERDRQRFNVMPGKIGPIWREEVEHQEDAEQTSNDGQQS